MIKFEQYQKFFDDIGKNKDNIVLINNFISDQDLILINQYLNSKKNDDDFIGGKDLRFEVLNLENPKLGKIILEYEEKIYKIITNHFTTRYNVPIKRKAINPVHFIKWTEGMSSGLHADCETHDGQPAEAADFYKYNIAVLAYPNDDYIGGEITFPDYNFVVKPKAGDLIIFPGNSYYRHTVELVQKGTRYTMPSWYTFDAGKEHEQRNYGTYLDSAQLWPDPNVDLLGIKTRDEYRSLKENDNK